MARGVVGRTTGVFAPRLKGGTADSAERNAQRPSTLPAGRFFTNPPQQPSGVQPRAGGTFQTDYTVIPKGYMDSEVGTAIAKAGELDDVLKAAEDAANKRGVVSNPYTNAIRLLQQQIAGGKYGTSYDDSIKIIQDQIDSGQYGTPYDRLSTQLGQTGLAAAQQIDAASLAAITGLSSRDPLAQSTYAPSTAQIPQAALSDYLTSIGAGTNEVDANRNFLQSMIDSENAQAQQYTSQINQAQDAQREAAIQAVYGNQAYSQSQLGTAQSAQEFAINAAREAELKKLTDQILGYTTDAATSKSEGLKNLQDQILQYTLKGGKTSGKKSNKKGGKK